MARAFAFGKGPWDPTHRFETSWLVSPWVLFGLRALMSLYAFTTLLFTIGYRCATPSLGGCAEARASFSYFTILTYWGIAFYSLISAVHTITYIVSASHSPLIDHFPRPVQSLHSFFHTTITTYPFLVTIVFWALLASPTTLSTEYSAWSNISQHALNSAYALFEVIVPRTDPMPWVHIPFLILILALYLALAYLTQATKGFYTYDFLDPGKQGSLVAAYVFGIAVGICIIFVVIWGITWLRKWITETKLGMRGKFARGDVSGATGHGDVGGGVSAGNGRTKDTEMGEIEPSL